MLKLSSDKAGNQDGKMPETISVLAEVHRQVADLLRDLPAAVTPEVARLGLPGALQQLARGELKNAFDRIDWRIHPEATENLHKIPQIAAEVVFYAAREAMRNAARHARGENNNTPLSLNIIINWNDGLDVVIEDNGMGMAEASREAGGSGRGLALHSTLLAVVGGSLSVESTPGSSTRINIKLPVVT
jgi:signal transduction histidine kinase